MLISLSLKEDRFSHIKPGKTGLITLTEKDWNGGKNSLLNPKKVVESIIEANRPIPIHVDVNPKEFGPIIGQILTARAGKKKVLIKIERFLSGRDDNV